MESIINSYISQELINKPDLLPLRNDESLLDTGILDSLSVLKLVLFLEEQFGVTIVAEDLLPENFGSIDAICTYLRIHQQEHRAAL